MSLRLRALAIVTAILAGIVALPALAPRAGADSRTVTVVTHDLAPFVVTQNDSRSGFTIDVWEEIAKREGWSTKFVDASGVDGQLKALAQGRADVAAGAISITAGRSASYDFSQPILNAGLQILVPADAHAQASLPGLKDFLALLFSKSMLVWLGAALALAVIPAHIIWLLERRDADSFVSKSYS